MKARVGTTVAAGLILAMAGRAADDGAQHAAAEAERAREDAFIRAVEAQVDVAGPSQWLALGGRGFSTAGGEKEKAPYLGVSTSPIAEAMGRQLQLPRGIGLLVEYVDPGSPAAGAVEVHDVLHKLDGQLLVSHQQLAVLLRIQKAGDEVALAVIRGGSPLTVTVKLAEKELPRLGAGGYTTPSFRIMRSPTITGGQGATNLSPRLRQWFEEQFQPLLDAPGAGGAGAAAPKGSARVRVGQPGAGSPMVTSHSVSTRITSAGGAGTFSLNNGDCNLTVKTDAEGHRTLEARNTATGETFTGPIDTDKDREAVPAGFRKGLDELDGMMNNMQIRLQGAGAPDASPEANAR